MSKKSGVEYLAQHPGWKTPRKERDALRGPINAPTDEALLRGLPDSDREFVDNALSAAESHLDNLLDKYSVEYVARFFEQQVRIHLREELNGAKRHGNDAAAYHDAVNNGEESI
jgi:hypothetical protein